MRQSNMELLRIAAMLMVVALHATTGGYGDANPTNVHADPVRWLGVTGTTMACIGCVDVFVLITGWFGTRFRWIGAARLVGQTAIVATAMYAVVWAVGGSMPHSLGDACKALWSYWFVQSYLLLYVLSPLLNAFIDRADERQLATYVGTFYAFFLPLWLMGNSDVANGYSTLSFVGLYLLGRYLRLYGAQRLARIRTRWFAALWVGLWAVGTMAIWGTAMWGTQASVHNLIQRLTAYSAPSVIVGSVALLLVASRLKLQSRAVNWLAAGSFSVYLTHQQLYLRKPYFQLVKDVAAAIPSHFLTALALLGVVVGVYLASTALDDVRRRLWRACGKLPFKMLAMPKSLLPLLLLLLSTLPLRADRFAPLRTWHAGTVVADSTVAAYGTERCFTIISIDDATFARMQGHSYRKGCPVSRADLRLVRVLHRNDEGCTQLGELVCHRTIATDVVHIFRRLYAAGYRISRIVPIDAYDGDDERSMTENNTTCFNFRPVAGTKVLSKHARGLAIDLNPLRNPMVRRSRDGRTQVSPAAGRRYADRSRPFAQRITEADLACRLFRAAGFRWGGNWRSLKDYQHFER